MKDLKGQSFNRLIAIKDSGKRNVSGGILWECLCDCGTICYVEGRSLTSEHTKSCGCLQREHASIMNKSHGMWGSREYNSWYNMKARCDNPNATEYEHYGGRGITYDPRWGKFENFYRDMGPRPEGTSIDRIDNDGKYNSDNCHWATPIQQNNNTKRNK